MCTSSTSVRGHFNRMWQQTPTQNLTEILQQYSFSVQYFLLSLSSVFSLFTLSSLLWPHSLFPLVLWMSRDTMTSLSTPLGRWKSVRSTREQEVVTGLCEGISRHGETGWGPFTGWGETCHCRVERDRSYTKWQHLNLLCMLWYFSYQHLPGCNSHFGDAYSKLVPDWQHTSRTTKRGQRAAFVVLSTVDFLCY